MKPVTIGYIPFHDSPEIFRDLSTNASEESLELAFRSISKDLDADDLAQCDFIFLRPQIYRWEWLDVLLGLKRVAPHIPAIVMVPEGSLKDGCQVMRMVPAVVLVDSPEYFVKTVSRVVAARRKFPKQILFVDDDENILSGYKHAFFRAPWKVYTASSARIAMELLSMEPMDLVITDIKMPGMHGIELIEEIRKIDKSLPIIVCSGYHGLKADSEMYFHNVSSFIEKPVEMAVLETKIKEVLN